MKPVWVDEQDEAVDRGVHNIDGERWRDLFKKRATGSVHEWAKFSEAKSNEKGEEAIAAQQMGASTVLSAAKKPKALHSNHLKFKLLQDVTVGHHQGPISVVKFHPIKPVLVTATTSGNISLFEICKDNVNLGLKRKDSFLQSVNFPRFRIEHFDFFDGGVSILASAGNQNHLYTYDLLSGKAALVRQPIVLDSLRTRMARLSGDGSLVGLLANSSDIFVFELKTMEHLHTFRSGENVVDFCFAPSSRNVLYSLTVGGAVNTFNLARHSAQETFFDYGCVRAVCISPSRSGQFIACGSNAGIVNVYDLTKLASNSPVPVRVFDQLTTSVSFVRFSHDSQMLAFGSAVKRMSGRLANCASGNVFQNFPAKQEHFASDRFTACDFSPNSAFFSFGTKQGKMKLYQMNHSQVY